MKEGGYDAKGWGLAEMGEREGEEERAHSRKWTRMMIKCRPQAYKFQTNTSTHIQIHVTSSSRMQTGTYTVSCWGAAAT